MLGIHLWRVGKTKVFKVNVIFSTLKSPGRHHKKRENSIFGIHDLKHINDANNYDHTYPCVSLFGL